MTADGKNIVVGADNRDSTAPQVWRIPIAGKRITRLTGRLADHPFLSPDGNWIGYLSQRNIFGLARDSVDLRAVRTDGTQDRLLALRLANNPYFTLDVCGSFSFSPDSSRIAVACDDTLVVVELNGGRSIRMPLPSIQCWWWLVAWDRFGSEVLVAPDPPADTRPGPLLACDPATGRIRTVRENREGRHHFVFPSTTKGIQFVLFGNSLLNVATGKEQRIAESDCYAAGMSGDRRFLVYGTEREEGNRKPRTEIHWRELASGHDEVIVTFPGLLSEPYLVSPLGDRVVANDNSEPMNERAIVFERTGAMRNFPPGWMAFGWANNIEIGLTKPLEKSISMALGDAATMKMGMIHP